LCNIVLAVSTDCVYLCVELWSEDAVLRTEILQKTVSSIIDQL